MVCAHTVKTKHNIPQILLYTLKDELHKTAALGNNSSYWAQLLKSENSLLCESVVKTLKLLDMH